MYARTCLTRTVTSVCNIINAPVTWKNSRICLHLWTSKNILWERERERESKIDRERQRQGEREGENCDLEILVNNFVLEDHLRNFCPRLHLALRYPGITSRHADSYVINDVRMLKKFTKRERERGKYRQKRGGEIEVNTDRKEGER